ncbi:MAG: hypothetical protein QNJ12_22270 [Ilumatobacter sp.]|uniref:hypothetical protein n=1 Tax=Ilumatobacter sp. TaxID=1967498 RepID=UPI00260210A8|nr:hypothetical protein [Ilumatobacter sp.]MDJ0771528.1 hypothetical protein [Ilumatobacter sp.]
MSRVAFSRAFDVLAALLVSLTALRSVRLVADAVADRSFGRLSFGILLVVAHVVVAVAIWRGRLPREHASHDADEDPTPLSN